ncbi:glycosyltransferase [Thermosulfurimonas sp. F29]|uniref:glycosyltransferase family 2 protein n=1 Tax=Thermosulfurimonas sp. F29 TaxID=2867247 RepID=UPI001C83D6FB|nr:glycosyltransferase [Thermosulfurimonas sp. F29]MBX6424294.1 glycosyltransferase [Thermosulfurimonas sp. F29]
MEIPFDYKWLKRFLRSEWPEYEAWIRRNQPLDPEIWLAQRKEAASWKNAPLISIVTPVYNTEPAFLFECVFSVLMQSYPYWELCLVDDGSDRTDTRLQLESISGVDCRIKLKRLERNRGIAAALNEGVKMARGEYVAFLDHDDVLHPEALYRVVEFMRNHPDMDILYTDRDELSPGGLRFRHLLKPAWSPETILSTIYLFHLTVWRRKFILKFRGGFFRREGPFRSEFDGSQDYDLLLRAIEKTPGIAHLPRVLYHWRQHPGSLAMRAEAKEYTFEAARRALEEALKRRGIPARAEEIPWLWRGNFRLRFERPPEGGYLTLVWKEPEEVRDRVGEGLSSRAEFLIFLGPEVHPLEEESIRELLYWFHVPEVGMVTGKILDPGGRLWHAGLVLKPEGDVLAVYRGFPESEPGYMAVTAVARNVSVPHPYCVAIRRKALLEAGFADELSGPHIFLDAALRMRDKGFRVVYNPFARFVIDPPQEVWLPQEREIFRNLHRKTLETGDPFYHPGLTLSRNDMSLKF